MVSDLVAGIYLPRSLRFIKYFFVPSTPDKSLASGFDGTVYVVVFVAWFNKGGPPPDPCE